MSKPRGKNGGKRPGAGRPPGARNALPLGWVGAVKSLKRRLPEDAPADARALDERTFARLVDVMEERVSHVDANAVLKAAQALRDELHGQHAQKIQHGFDDVPTDQLQAKYDKLMADALSTVSATKPPEGSGS